MEMKGHVVSPSSSKPRLPLTLCNLNACVIINIVTCSETISSETRSTILCGEKARNVPNQFDKRVSLAPVWRIAFVFKAQQDRIAVRPATSGSIVFYSVASLFLPPLLVLKLDKGHVGSLSLCVCRPN